MQSQEPTKWYKVIRRGADPVYLEMSRLELMMSDPNQLLKYIEDDGNWRLINKADIVDASYDKKYTESMLSQKSAEQWDKYYDKKENKILMVKLGTLPEDLTRYEKVK